MGDDRGEQRLVVDVARGTRQQPPFPDRFRERLVSREFTGFYPVLRVGDDAGPASQAEPVALRLPQVRGDILPECLRLNGLKEAGFLCADQPPGIRRYQQVRRRARTLGFEPFDQFVGPGLDHVDLDAGFLGKAGEQLLVRLVVAVSVEVHLAAQGGVLCLLFRLHRLPGAEEGGACNQKTLQKCVLLHEGICSLSIETRSQQEKRAVLPREWPDDQVRRMGGGGLKRVQGPVFGRGGECPTVRLRGPCRIPSKCLSLTSSRDLLPVPRRRVSTRFQTPVARA